MNGGVSLKPLKLVIKKGLMLSFLTFRVLEKIKGFQYDYIINLEIWNLYIDGVKTMVMKELL